MLLSDVHKFIALKVMLPRYVLVDDTEIRRYFLIHVAQ